MVDKFLTISKKSESLYKEKGSKFIGISVPVRSEDEVKESLEAIKKEYYDARHHCYAHVLQPDASQTRANDDGEPNHSAGDPILGQIKSKNLTNTLVVVARYFGGTKLGVSGLITAYKTAAKEALEENSIIEEEVRDTLVLKFPYEEMNEVMKLVGAFDLKILNQGYEDMSTLTVAVLVSKRKNLSEKITFLNDIGHKIFLPS